jgi:hypothetical protein
VSATLINHVHLALDVLADVPNPAPVDPTGGSNGVNLLISYTKWGALIALAIVAVASGAMMAVGKLSNRPDTAEKGKTAFVWSVGGAVVVAIAIPLINSVFGAAS